MKKALICIISCLFAIAFPQTVSAYDTSLYSVPDTGDLMMYVFIIFGASALIGIAFIIWRMRKNKSDDE